VVLLALAALGDTAEIELTSILIALPKVAKASSVIKSMLTMEQRTLKNVNNCLNTNIYSYLETSGGESYNQYLNLVHFFNTCVN
jgi:hypothetical protein